ncbi:unnamed protein product [Coregonus sp. 'balchen']|nr:unnamed protein product [Coregonus sp. 'balchen']
MGQVVVLGPALQCKHVHSSTEEKSKVCRCTDVKRASSLTVSITDMRAPVVGGSGGVYALCSAHLANVVMVTAIIIASIVTLDSGINGDKIAKFDAYGNIKVNLFLSTPWDPEDMKRDNWAGMRCPYKLLRMILALVCRPQPSFMAHLSGAVVGISMGLLILRSYEESLQKQCSWWVIVFSFITFLLFAIFWNIFAYELLGVQLPPAP